MIIIFALGWDSGEISHYEIHEPILPYCSNSALPPYPLPPIVSRVPVSTTACPHARSDTHTHTHTVRERERANEALPL